MNDIKQPEALRLAAACESEIQATVSRDILMQEAAAELRRLHSLNQWLLEALKGACKAMELALHFMQCDAQGTGPDCAPVFQALINAKSAIAKSNRKTSMSDITMCADKHCTNYANCYRAQAAPSERQSFFALSPREGTECHLYAPMNYTDGASALKEQPQGEQPPMDENSAVVFTAPQGWGKTRDAKHLLKIFGLNRLLDDWIPGMPIQDRTLHLTNVPPDELERLQLPCRVTQDGWTGRAIPPKDEHAPGEIS